MQPLKFLYLVYQFVYLCLYLSMFGLAVTNPAGLGLWAKRNPQEGGGVISSCVFAFFPYTV